MRGREELVPRSSNSSSATIFLVEYLAAAVDIGRGSRLWRRPARLRPLRAVSLPAIIDLLAMSTLFLTFFGNETSILRLFRLVRILLAGQARPLFDSDPAPSADAVRSRRYELMMSLVIARMLLLVSSTLLYIVEGDVQPERLRQYSARHVVVDRDADHRRLWRRHSSRLRSAGDLPD